jgi:Protein of unknown function (DUF4058)
MRSPFPGMDPFLEQFWGDVHHTLINRSRAAIQKELPADLVARVDERVFVEPAAGSPRSVIPDVRVVERGRPEKPVLRASNGVAVAEPLVIHIEQDEPVRQGFIEIIDLKSGRRVVTVIEFISPSNKVTGPGRDLYVKKLGELRDGGVSLVEFDLNRTGSRIMSAPFELIPDGHRSAYAACVRKGWKPQAIDYYRLPLRERLPAIAIPLRETDPVVPLDLQAVLDECCEEGRYIDDLDYRHEPVPPLSPDDTKWIDALLREHGLR